MSQPDAATSTEATPATSAGNNRAVRATVPRAAAASGPSSGARRTRWRLRLAALAVALGGGAALGGMASSAAAALGGPPPLSAEAKKVLEHLRGTFSAPTCGVTWAARCTR